MVYGAKHYTLRELRKLDFVYLAKQSLASKHYQAELGNELIPVLHLVV
jgi:hypothetical protein